MSPRLAGQLVAVRVSGATAHERKVIKPIAGERALSLAAITGGLGNAQKTSRQSLLRILPTVKFKLHRQKVANREQ